MLIAATWVVATPETTSRQTSFRTPKCEGSRRILQGARLSGTLGGATDPDRAEAVGLREVAVEARVAELLARDRPQHHLKAELAVGLDELAEARLVGGGHPSPA